MIKQMTATQFKVLLTKLGACQDAKDWAKGKSLKVVWETCERGDWLLWLCGYMVGQDGWPTRKQVVLAACACSETSFKYLPKGERRPQQTIEVVRRWVRGEATLEEVESAVWSAARSARSARSAAESAARSAAWSAESAARSAAWSARSARSAAESAARSAAWSAESAARSAAWSARSAAESAALKDLADIVRKELHPVVIYGDYK